MNHFYDSDYWKTQDGKFVHAMRLVLASVRYAIPKNIVPYMFFNEDIKTGFIMELSTNNDAPLDAFFNIEYSEEDSLLSFFWEVAFNRVTQEQVYIEFSLIKDNPKVSPSTKPFSEYQVTLDRLKTFCEAYFHNIESKDFKEIDSLITHLM